ncbi:putative peptidoglycan binding protein [Streptomyces sp. BK340]|nr:putative peptidoglycan binding protein [Streptomyces sp. BK340]
MTSRATRAKLIGCSIGALTAATLALSASPASASGTYSGQAYVYGAGAFSNDWDDEGILSTGTNTASNATCLWQKILWADGNLTSASDIDGVFGSQTKAATKAWQSDWEANPDGVVGKETFGKAGDWLRDTDGDGAVDTYIGTAHSISVSRDDQGRYHFYDGDGNGRIAGYDYRTCS